MATVSVSQPAEAAPPASEMRLLKNLAKAAEEDTLNLSQWQALLIWVAQSERFPRKALNCAWILQMSKDHFAKEKNVEVGGKGNPSKAYLKWMHEGYQYTDRCVVLCVCFDFVFCVFFFKKKQNQK